MTVSDDTLLRHLCRQSKEFAPFSRSEVILLDGSGAEDNIIVEELHSNDGGLLRTVRGVALLLPSIEYDRAFLTRPDVVPDFLCGLIGCSRCLQAIGYHSGAR